VEVHRLLRGKLENILQVPAARAQSFRLSRRLISAQILSGSCACWGVAEVLLVLGIPASDEGADRPAQETDSITLLGMIWNISLLFVRETATDAFCDPGHPIKGVIRKPALVIIPTGAEKQ